MMGAAHPMFVEELASRLGYSPDYFRRHIDRLIVEKHMPQPLPALGWKRWDRTTIEAWLAGYLPRKPANDVVPATSHDVETQRALLRRAYGRAS